MDDQAIKLAIDELPTQFSKVLMELEMRIARNEIDKESLNQLLSLYSVSYLYAGGCRSL